MGEWPVHEAKRRFSELIERSKDGPQVITRHGKEHAVILSPDATIGSRPPSRTSGPTCYPDRRSMN